MCIYYVYKNNQLITQIRMLYNGVIKEGVGGKMCI